MRAADPRARLRELISRPLVKVCGLTREEDVAVAVEAGADLCGFILEPASPRAAAGVLPVPETTLSVAVLVGEPEDANADLVQLYEREDGSVRGRDARAAPRGRAGRDGRRPPLGRGRPDAPRPGARDAGTVVLAGGLDPDNVRARDRRGRPVGRRRELEPRVEPRREGSTAARAAGVRGGARRFDQGAVLAASYGGYGGRYVPETLIPALDELERGLARGAGRPVLRRRARPARPRVRGPADAAHARRAVRARASASTSSART